MIRIVGIAIALALSAAGPAMGRDAPAAPNWDAALAREAAAVPESQSRVGELFALLRAGDRAALDARLDQVIRGGGLMQPVRDAILFQFAIGLAEFDAVDAGLIDRLRAVEPRVFVPHEERAHFGQPLFDIAGAAEGVHQLGLRRQARAHAVQAMNGPPTEWLEAYLGAETSEQAGFTDALDQAEPGALGRILEASLDRLPAAPRLTPISGKAALLLGDGSALALIVRSGGGADLARILEAAALTLPPDQAMSLLHDSIEKAPAANAALAIAQLYPTLSRRDDASALLFQQLGHPDLGAAAALALAGAGGPGARAELARVADSGEEPAASRARTALELSAQSGGLRR